MSSQAEKNNAINQMLPKHDHHGGSWASPNAHEDRRVCSGSMPLFDDGSWQDIEGDLFSHRDIEDEIISTFECPYWLLTFLDNPIQLSQGKACAAVVSLYLSTSRQGRKNILSQRHH
jgi:hypothetical protein